MTEWISAAIIRNSKNIIHKIWADVRQLCFLVKQMQMNHILII